MATYNNREVHLVARPDGMPKPEDFAVVETSLNASGEDIVVQNLYMSVDPAMRPALSNGATPLDKVMAASAIGRVVESGDANFPEGTYVRSRLGFREYSSAKPDDLEVIVPDGESLTTHLHVLGMTGLTAYGGLLVTGALQDGENVFVSAAAGAVGSVVGQIAKIKGCRVVGSCGSDEKVKHLVDDLGLPRYPT